jgi:hypothetical protein
MDKDHGLLLTKNIKPDYGFYVQSDDRLFVAAYSSVASLRVVFGGYFLNARGEVSQYSLDVFPTSDRAVTSALQTLGEGFVLSCAAHLLTGSAKRGQCYVRARIQRGTGATILPIVQLLSGYLSDDYAPAFPFGKSEGPLEGSGMIRSITGSNPAAGAEISETVPTGAQWRLLAFRATLVADATVLSRTPVFTVDDGTSTVWDDENFAALSAGQTGLYSRALHQSGRGWGGASGSVGSGLPLLILPAGYRVRTGTIQLQAGDNWSAPQLMVEEWLSA